MSPAESFQRRVRSLVDAAGGKKPLARRFGVTDSAITSWLAGSTPFESKLRSACEKTGISLAWLRDGHGRADTEVAKVSSGAHSRRPVHFGEDNRQSPRMTEEPPAYNEGGWGIVVRVLADRLTSTQIAEALNEILSRKEIDESVRNYASQILIAAQLPKLKR